jgi:hypothetical protein
MGMFEEIQEEAIVKGPPCTVSLILQQMSKDEVKDFELACADASIAGTIIAKVLARRGYKVTPPAIRRHRRGECRCE